MLLGILNTISLSHRMRASPWPPAGDPSQTVRARGSDDLYRSSAGQGQVPELREVRNCTWTGNGALIVHGPRAARCPGSGSLPVPWLAATGLPRWDDLTDRDKGAALLLVLEHGPNLCASEAGLPVYLDDPVLAGLDPADPHARRRRRRSLGCSALSASWERAVAGPGAPGRPRGCCRAGLAEHRARRGPGKSWRGRMTRGHGGGRPPGFSDPPLGAAGRGHRGCLQGAARRALPCPPGRGGRQRQVDARPADLPRRRTGAQPRRAPRHGQRGPVRPGRHRRRGDRLAPADPDAAAPPPHHGRRRDQHADTGCARSWPR